MTPAERYKINAQAAADRLKELADDSAITDLKSEIALTRMIAEDAINHGAGGIALAAMTAINKLAKSQEASDLRNRAMVDRELLFAVGAALVNLIAEEIEGRPGFEDVIDTLAARVPHVIRSVCQPKIEQ